METAKRFAKAILPQSLISRIRRWPYRSGNPSTVFSHVYSNSVWGKSDTFDSGTGSRVPGQYLDYVEHVTEFLASLPAKPDVVDLGCGDFNIGKQIRPYAARYVACDVVPDLIARNREMYRDLDVEFRVTDITSQDVPDGDIVIVRQVMQHLSNGLVARVLDQLGKYQYAIITEHVPDGEFEPNADILTGPYTRMTVGSGLDLLAPPFSLQAIDIRELTRVNADEGGIITTTVYRMS